ncbi:hypothetical protein [Cryptosporangium aurantiacum]|uniref:Uncharacterized protein n=1 Tax=Cryptosporangium aurantiacum TaxID=134849 RepID=A0A1M7RJF1_9ACTN|nr:hypothetical protein [Cryptosporangium aurantiacum]SHN46475.1 hypothetical protein SAMN05443668_11611 [Cryptosporangium aurantiacum]
MPRRRYWLSYVYVLVGALLLFSGFVLLYPVRHVEGFATELRISIGSNLIDLVLAVLVLQPLVLSLNRNAVRWRNRLDYRDVIRRINKAEDRVDLWKYWTGLLEPPHRQAFVTAVRAALDRGVRFRILLTDPSCPDAAERARQVAPTDAVTAMRQNIEQLAELTAELPSRNAELFGVRISAFGPAHAIYRVDDWLSYGLFRDRRVSENSQREVRVRGDLGELALEAFANRWDSAGLQGIAEHYTMCLRFTAPGEVVEHDLRYVLHDGEHWVDVGPHAVGPAHDVTVCGRGDERYVLADASPETRERALALYAAKYGPDQDAALLRLINP